MLPFVHVPLASQSTVTAQVRVEARERIESSESTVGSTDDAALETELAPILRFDHVWHGGDDQLGVLYSPRFILPNTVNAVSGDFSDRRSKFSPYQVGGFALEIGRPRWRLSLAGFGAYGSITTSALLYQRPWQGDGVPAEPYPILPADRAARFTVVFYQPQAAFTYRLTRFLSVRPLVRYNAFGGADGESRATIPLSRGPVGELHLDVRATKEDTFSTLVGAAYTQVLAAQLDVAGNYERDREGAPITNVFGEQRWQHRFSTRTTTELALGATIAQTRTQGTKLAPTGEASVVYRKKGLRLALVARQAPWVNLFAGEYEPRTSGTFAANVDLTKQLYVQTQMTAARTLGSLDSISRYTLGVGDVGLGYRITREASVDIGGRLGIQDLSNANLDSTTTQGIIYGGFTYAPRPFKL
ncbi:MAG: hypothetical protein JNL38_25340 [Myxococcales bacterium]|nr:hypothetical protein [Myxococcales bacterium]